MPRYDRVADRYDEHFHRPQDRWEDERLTDLLRPHVEGRHVIDLGCGTGWLLDHLRPASYVGVDESAVMLEHLLAKHPWANVVKARVGEPRWWDAIPWGAADAVVSTWAAHDLGSLPLLLVDARGMLLGGGVVALHGQGPRYRHRHHYVLDGEDQQRNYRWWRPDLHAIATPPGLHYEGTWGTGAYPDAWPPLKPLWRLAADLTPASGHYATLALWRN